MPLSSLDYFMSALVSSLPGKRCVGVPCVVKFSEKILAGVAQAKPKVGRLSTFQPSVRVRSDFTFVNHLRQSKRIEAAFVEDKNRRFASRGRFLLILRRESQ